MNAIPTAGATSAKNNGGSLFRRTNRKAQHEGLVQPALPGGTHAASRDATTPTKESSNGGGNGRHRRRYGLFPRCNRSFAIFFFLFVMVGLVNVFIAHTGMNQIRADGLLRSMSSSFTLPSSLSSMPPASVAEIANQLTKLKSSTATNHACDGYDGVYHIRMGDKGGAAGTIFFQFVLGQIIYAERNNLKPWVHLDNVSYVIYDNEIHAAGDGVSFSMMDGMTVTWVDRPNGHWKDASPGRPVLEDGRELVQQNFHFDGTGVWGHYFEPVSDFVPGDASCRNKPLISMSLKQITPGIHGYSDWAPRCWRYQYLPDYITKPFIPLQEWLEPQRHLANDVLKRYIKLRPEIERKASEINPSCSMQNACLGLHIRHSDKAAGRRQIETSEFLPYATAFLRGGGKWIYLATDSSKVLDEIAKEWPQEVQERLRTIGSGIVRSSDFKAVFEIASHHRTNTEILIEILALAKCQFMVHGLSAVTETSVWINVDLHYTSVNLEDPDRRSAQHFAKLVADVLNGANATQLVHAERFSNWWRQSGIAPGRLNSPTTNKACDGYKGVLHIESVGKETAASGGFFVSVLNQLAFAEQNNLTPWVHLNGDSSRIYDAEFHGHTESARALVESMTDGLRVVARMHDSNHTMVYPSEIMQRDDVMPTARKVFSQTDGIWEYYFHPVSDFVPGDTSCDGKPIISLTADQVSLGLNAWSPSAIRAWRYDDVPEELWNPNSAVSQREWMSPMRLKAQRLVAKYFQFQPHIPNRAHEVNPVHDDCIPCLAVHLRNSDKSGAYRAKFPAKNMREYMEAFLEAGGETIYVAADSSISLEFIEQHFTARVRQAIRTQGPYVVRGSKFFGIHDLAGSHRTNTEVLVDIVAMSKCQFLLHGYSAVSEAAIYLNPALHANSINMEVGDEIMDVEEFSRTVGQLVKRPESKSCLTAEEQKMTLVKREQLLSRGAGNLTIHRHGDRPCRRNAIVFLAQKKHSSYKRDSFANLLEALRLLEVNYLSIDKHAENADVFIFHTGDFNSTDLKEFRASLTPASMEAIHIVDISLSRYWRRPSWHEFDDPHKWYVYPLFSEGYRRMIHFFAIDIWKFFDDYNHHMGCNYTYIMRLDEDSYIHSRIEYDLFDFMNDHSYDYGYRLCAYEMGVALPIWGKWQAKRGRNIPIHRNIEGDMCGIYNNFFIARVGYFLSWPVNSFLGFVDRQGMIYRRRLGDLMIHSMAVFAFAPKERVHRFLDFTYEHGTPDQMTGCVVWGGIQAGYKDTNARANLMKYHDEKVSAPGCDVNITYMKPPDLSPSYSHLVENGVTDEVSLHTIMVGKVERFDMGQLSG